MARKRKRGETPSDELPMTPMIDVVFQLLMYFIFSIKPIDVFAELDVSRPSPEKQQQEMQTPPKLIRINIFADGFAINDLPVPPAEMERLLFKLAALDRNQTIMIMASNVSPHEMLIRVLDLCAKAKLTNLSVVSTN